MLLKAISKPACAHRTIVVVGHESVGKSQLIASLTGRACYSSNFRGTTVACESFELADTVLIDTPGILRQSDTETTRLALDRLEASDTVLLVVKATHIDDELEALLPLVRKKHGAIAVTFWDKVHDHQSSRDRLRDLESDLDQRIVPLDTRRMTSEQRSHLWAALREPRPFTEAVLRHRAGWRIEPRRGLLDRRVFGPLLAIALLLVPAFAAVWAANHFAALLDPVVSARLGPIAAALKTWPSLVRDLLAGRYGLVTMGPLMFVWAVPTVVLYALFLGAYKASGLIDRINVAIHPLMRPFGLAGRDAVRVIMGFGCNVPAVISTRACSRCSRGTCISAISFGSACSYQYGATLAVFAAAGATYLWLPYLAYLLVTTLIYTRLVAPPLARSPLNLMVIEGRTFLEWPRLAVLWRESRGTLRHFFFRAIPIFLLISLLASALDWLGAIDVLAKALGPVMRVFRLPTESALPVVFASIRKDGILLFDQPDLLGKMSAVQILTGVYLASVLLPCLVTALTIAREQSPRFAAKLVGRQALAACLFAVILAQAGRYLELMR